VPSLKCFPRFIIEHTSADLQQQVGILLTSAHLLFLYHSLAHHIVDGRFYKCCGDGFGISPVLFQMWVSNSSSFLSDFFCFCVGPSVLISILSQLAVCRARKTFPYHRNHLIRSNSFNARSRRSNPDGPKPFATWRNTVSRMVIWNQSRRCSALEFRYNCKSQTVSAPSDRNVTC
jgi:hypothetical protein